MYTIRFWNIANECIMIGGRYSHIFETFEDAWESANALLVNAYSNGATQMDINNEFYDIEEA